jgi:Ca2+/Na+ antiporter
MLRILLFLLFLYGSAHSEERSPRESEHKTETAQIRERAGHSSQQITVPTNSTAPTVINIFASKHADGKSECTSPDWKEWGSFALCKSLEWLDAEKTIAIFTVILAFATFYLWLATRALVRDAKETSQRQLRAYISANPSEISSAEKEERFVQITFILKNLGQTPARELHYIFDFSVFPNPLPIGFNYPAPTTPIHAGSTLFPQADMKVWFSFDRLQAGAVAPNVLDRSFEASQPNRKWIADFTSRLT